jgi:hypothetical protein
MLSHSQSHVELSGAEALRLGPVPYLQRVCTTERVCVCVCVERGCCRHCLVQRRRLDPPKVRVACSDHQPALVRRHLQACTDG